MKQGFVIVKNKLSKDFFSAKGSYDRPIWAGMLEEATVYYSDGSAKDAVKKLWMNGNYSAKVIPLAEFEISFVKPAHEDPTDDQHNDAEMSADVDNPDSSEEPTDDIDPDIEGNVDDEDSGEDDTELSADIDGDMQSDSRMDDDGDDHEDKECHCPMTDGRHEEDCEYSSMSDLVRGMQDEERAVVDTSNVVHVGQKVKWNGQDAEVIVPNAQADFVVIRVDGMDRKVPIGQLSMEGVESFGLGVDGERAARAKQGEMDWRTQAQTQRGPTKIYIRTAKGRYGPYKDAGEAQRVMLAMGLGMGAKVVQEMTLPKRPDAQGNAASDDKNPQIIPNLSEPKINDIDFADPTETADKPETDLYYSGALQNGEKVKIPPNVLSALRDSINVFKKAADYNNTRDDAQASFCMTVASAMEELLDHLSIGTADGIKQAQIKMTSWMNPITTNIPPEVRDFVLRGGRQPSLKDLFDMKKEEALLAKVRKGLNQKG